MRVQSIVLFLFGFVTEFHVNALELVANQRRVQTCSVSDEERAEQIMNLLKTISDEATFDDTDSPQSQAANWLLEEDDYSVCPDEANVAQRYILALMYFATDGDNWNECFANDSDCGTNDNEYEGQVSYLSPVDECEWAGSTCFDGSLGYLYYQEFNNMVGELPNELVNLTSLEVLSVEKQNITGTIPDVIGQMQTLRIVDFDYNQLVGPIPESIYNLVNLEELDLNDNELTGTISESIGNLIVLSWLQLQDNNFVGTFPSSLTQIPLDTAEFYQNDFTGLMPLCVNATDQTITWVSLDCFGDNPDTFCEEDCGCVCY